MSAVRYLKCGCPQCDGHIEFPAEGLGLTVNCPHCGQAITLITGVQSIKKWVAIAAMVLVLVISAGVAAAVFYLKKMSGPEKPAPVVATVPSPANTNAPAKVVPAVKYVTETNEFKITEVHLQKTENSGLVYAIGTVKNNTTRQRFGVKIGLDLLDEQGTRIGGANDYIAVMEPRKDWQFRALVVNPKTVKVTTASIEEQK